MTGLTDFQRYMWRRHGFLITGRQGQVVETERYADHYVKNVLVEKSGDCDMASVHERLLWRALERNWRKARKART